MRGLVHAVRALWRRLAGSARPADMERRLTEEMQFHLDMHAERSVAGGMDPAEARRVAAITFGGRERFAEEARDEYRSRPLEELAYDVRYAVRALRRAPAYTTAAALTL